MRTYSVPMETEPYFFVVQIWRWYRERWWHGETQIRFYGPPPTAE